MALREGSMAHREEDSTTPTEGNMVYREGSMSSREDTVTQREGDMADTGDGVADEHEMKSSKAASRGHSVVRENAESWKSGNPERKTDLFHTNHEEFYKNLLASVIQILCTHP